jgi:PqqD family protein of HPr-rel-A system
MVDAPNQPMELAHLRWQAAALADLCWAQFGDQWAVYHRPSGKTHFVNAATARLLRELLTRPHTVNEVLPELLAAASPTEHAEIRVTAGELLLRLEELGLVDYR